MSGEDFVDSQNNNFDREHSNDLDSNNISSSNNPNLTELESENNIGRRILMTLMSDILNVSENSNENLMELSERIGNVERGIDNIEDVSNIVNDSGVIMCPICQMESNTKVRRTICHHSFCDECISQWLSKSKKCPSCMQDLEDLSHQNS